MTSSFRADNCDASRPTVSVVITCYNHADYIGQAIQSILDQSYTDFEIIISDDGSTDNSLELIRSYRDPKIRVISERNAGPSVSTLRALKLSRGSLIILLAGDDFCAPHRLEHQVEEMRDLKLGATFCLPQLVNDRGEFLPDSSWPVFFQSFPETSEELLSRFFFHGNFLCGTSVMIRRELLDKVGPWHCGLVQLQDFEKWVALLPHCGFSRSNERHTYYRVRESGLNLSSHSNRWRSVLEKKLVYRSFFSGIEPSFIFKAFSKYLDGHPSRLTRTVEHLVYPLYLAHSDPIVRMVGIEMMIECVRSPDDYEVVLMATNRNIWSIYNEAQEIYGLALAKEIRRFQRVSRSRGILRRLIQKIS